MDRSAAGLLSRAEADQLLSQQCDLIERELQRAQLSRDAAITLHEMHRDYGAALAD